MITILVWDPVLLSIYPSIHPSVRFSLSLSVEGREKEEIPCQTRYSIKTFISISKMNFL
jgi:hypothetical protein